MSANVKAIEAQLAPLIREGGKFQAEFTALAIQYEELRRKLYDELPALTAQQITEEEYNEGPAEAVILRRLNWWLWGN